MKHIGIDLGSRESQICVRQADGQIVEEKRWPTDRLGQCFRKHGSSRVIMESCAEAFAVGDIAQRESSEVRIVPATLTRTLGVGARGIKTDQRDGRVLSQVSCRIELPSIHIPSFWSREIKSQLGMRQRLIGSRTMLINNLRGWLRGQLLRLRGGAVNTFGERLRKKLLASEQGLPRFIERQLEVIELLNQQIAEADTELKELASNHSQAKLLLSVPGVGTLTALAFVASVDQVDRFSDAHQLESYLGLTPGERSSSNKKQRTSITKAGAQHIRWLLVQAAWCAWRTRPNEPMVLWAEQVAQRRGRLVAVVALARKMAGILWALLRDQATYESRPSRNKTA